MNLSSHYGRARSRALGPRPRMLRNQPSERFERVGAAGDRLLLATRGSFDGQAFFSALDGTRLARDLTWKDVAAEAGVSASSLTRIGQGRRPDVDTLSALCVWSGLDAGSFMGGHDRTRAESLAAISEHVRTDPNLSPANAALLDELIKSSYERLRNAS